MAKITLYGDSILKGVLLGDGRYSICGDWELAFSRRFGSEIRNLSRFGATVEKGLSLMRRDVAQSGNPGDYAVIEYGGNDCDFLWEKVAANPDGEHLCNVPPAKFKNLLREAVSFLRGVGCVPVLVTLPPIDPDRYLRHICRSGLSRDNILRFLGDVNAIYRWEEKYSRLVEAVAAAEKTALVDLREAFLAARSLGSLLCDDGIHPTREGQKLIFDTFAGRAAAIGLGT